MISILEFILLFVGWGMLWFFILPEDYKDELGAIVGFLAMIAWFIVWCLITYFTDIKIGITL